MKGFLARWVAGESAGAAECQENAEEPLTGASHTPEGHVEGAPYANTSDVEPNPELVDLACASAAEGPAYTSVRPKPEPTNLAQASANLTQAGVRIMEVEGATTIGIWSDVDGPDVRSALFTRGSGQLPIRYLDAGDIPIRYKSRWVEGEPVPMNVLRAMEANPVEPWVIRDRMLDEMCWWPKGRPWAEWKAQELNRFFQEQGVIGEPGQLTAATVRHGEQVDQGGITANPGKNVR